MVLTALLSLLGLAVLPFTLSTSPPWTRSDSIHIPITRRSNRARGLQDLAMAADHLRAKYNFTTRWKGKRAGTVVDVPITNEVCCFFTRGFKYSNPFVVHRMVI
jgi:hypothetical protein